MDRKTIAFILICPVLSAGCSQQEAPPAVTVHEVQSETGYVTAGPMFPVRVPDSLATPVIWSESVELLVVETAAGGNTLQGDTLIMGSDPFLAMEMDRLSMELQIASASGDSIASDSLEALLADSSIYTAVEAPLSGIVQILVTADETLQPGDTLAVITGSPPDSLFFILPSEGHIRWPDHVPGCTVNSGELVCSGVIPGDSVIIPGVYRIEPRYVHEEGLETFLLSASGDTVEVTVMGSYQEFRTVFSEVQLDSIPLTGWD